MSTVEAILKVVDSIWNWFWLLINRITIFFNSVLEILSYIWQILSALWYWLTSLLSWIWDLVLEVLRWWVFLNVASAFSTLASYIWWPAVVFLSTLMFIIIFRIFLAFVFKILRLNIDYHNTQSKTRSLSQHESLK